MVPSGSRWNKVKSYARAAWWNIKCAAILPFWRPNPKCPFDRIPGEEYYDGTVEPEVELTPYVDNLPLEEFLGRSSEPVEPEEEEYEPGGPEEPEEDPEDTEDDQEEDEEDPDDTEEEDSEYCECSDDDDDDEDED
jgi:hypothetical protein